jgi:hypothetical protein
MKISSPKIEKTEHNIIYSSGIIFQNSTEKDLWFKIESNYENWITDSSDPLLLSMLLPAMTLGEDISVEGSVSEELYYACSIPLQSILIELIPSLKPIKITASSFYKSEKINNAVVTGFSSGVDSFTTINDFYYNSVTDLFKITHLLFNDLGSHGNHQDLFESRYQRCKKVADILGLDLIKIVSNIDFFYKHKELGFMQTHTIRNSVIPHLLSPAISKFYYSSAYQYKNIGVKRAIDIAYIDPIILPMLSTNNTKLISVGSEYTRVEKTKIISKMPITYDFLDVCTTNNKTGVTNCSWCKKCLRTITTIDLLGKLPQYSAIFDLDKYNKLKKDFISSLSNNEPFEKEILNLLKKDI